MKINVESRLPNYKGTTNFYLYNICPLCLACLMRDDNIVMYLFGYGYGFGGISKNSVCLLL